MRLTKLQQSQISGSLLPNDNMTVLVGENRTLIDDLNSLRTQIRKIQGTSTWTDNLSGSQDLADIYAGMRVDATTGIVNLMEDVYVADDAFVSGSITSAEIIKAMGGFSGSLTKLMDGSDYLLAGKNISTVTGALGAIEIVANPGAVTNGVQYNVDGYFMANQLFTFAMGTNESLEAMGRMNLSGSISSGLQTRAAGDYSQAMGEMTLASGYVSHTEGYLTTGSANYAHAEGWNTLASGLGSHAEGRESEARGSASHAEGILSVAGGLGAHAEGSGSLAAGIAAHSEGQLTSAPGNYSHAEGWATITSGSWSHAEGRATITSGSWSHAEGVYTVARGEASHAEGSGSLSAGIGSHAEGKDTTALGDFSHAGGLGTLASGYASTAIGSGAVSAGNYSFAAGEYVVASGSSQAVIGRWNKENNGDSLFVIGGGTSDNDRRDLMLVGQNTITMGSASLASDTFFHVTSNGQFDKSKFDGSVIVDGFVRSVGGLSGSLTKLSDNTDYLISGPSISITTGSNGAVTVGFNTNSVRKEYFAGNSAYLTSNTFDFGPSGAGLGTLSTATDEFIDVYLNGVFLTFGPSRDITNITNTSFTLNSTIAGSLNSTDIIAVVLRNLA